MNFYDAVYEITRSSGMSIEDLSLKLKRGPKYIASSKSRGSLPKMDNAAMILEALDYKLCIVPADDIPEDAIVID